MVITVVSLLLAALTGISNFRKYGDLWLAYRTTEELVKKELFLFQTEADRFMKKNSAFTDFLQNVESTISAEHERFRSLNESSRRPTTQEHAGATKGLFTPLGKISRTHTRVHPPNLLRRPFWRVHRTNLGNVVFRDFPFLCLQQL